LEPDPEPRELAAQVPELRVLLAEDNAVNQRLGRLMVEKLGHRIDVVGNGHEATEAVHLVPYDVILMDVEMPEMDGLEATRIIRRALPISIQPKIVAMTANALEEVRQACTDSGMDGYLSKPVRIGELDTVLREATADVVSENSLEFPNLLGAGVANLDAILRARTSNRALESQSAD
jgi:CheY-like chemotaxis protein